MSGPLFNAMQCSWGKDLTWAVEIPPRLAALRAGGWKGRLKEACSVHWDNNCTNKTRESLPTSTEGTERWGCFRRIRAMWELVLCSAHYKLNHQAFSSGSSPLGRRQPSRRTHQNSLCLQCFFTCQLRTRERGRLLKIGGMFSTFFIILFCLNHLNLHTVDLEEG